MAQIDIRRPHGMSEDAAKRRAEDLAKRLELRRGVRWRWDGDVLRLDAPSGPAKGTRGTVRVDGEAVSIQVELPLLLRAMRSMVESTIQAKLDTMLGKV